MTRSISKRTLLFLGGHSLAFTMGLGELAHFSGRILRRTFTFEIDSRELLRQLDRLCLRSLPLLLGGSVLTGGIIAIQGLQYVARYNATEIFGWATGLSAFKEVGPLLIGLTLAARLGTKNAAEIATLRARERLTALTALGVDVERAILAPRAMAIFLSGLLFFPLCSLAILGSAFLTAAALGQQNLASSYYSLVEYTPPQDILFGILRMWLFSGCVGLLSTFFGNTSGRDPRSLGRAVFASSVSGMTAIVVANLYLSFIGTQG